MELVLSNRQLPQNLRTILRLTHQTVVPVLILLTNCTAKDGSLYQFRGDGRSEIIQQESVWVADRPVFDKTSTQPTRAIQWKQALRRQLALLDRQKERPNSIISVQDRERVARLLGGGIEELPLKRIKFLRLKGDGTTNVQFTGYYTPIIEARRLPDQRFRYPLYSYPKQWKGKGPHLSRQEIDDQKKLAGLNLELAYTADPSDNFFMQVQGSGMVRYLDGSLEMLAYAGKNGHAYISVGRLLVERRVISKSKISMNAIRLWCAKEVVKCAALYNENPSYVFFRRGAPGPVGSGGEVVTGGYSIAVDPKIIPLGSILLAKVPVLDTNGLAIRHDWRLLLAQDTGGAIKGPAHIDLYTGVGNQAAEAAQALHHYGQVWLILPATK